MAKDYASINVKVDLETKNMLDRLALMEPNKKKKRQADVISELIREKFAEIFTDS